MSHIFYAIRSIVLLVLHAIMYILLAVPWLKHCFEFSLPRFKYYNNKYLRPVLTREHANAEPKIFETYSKLNVADAMNLVKQNSNLLPGVAGNDLGVSLSSLFKSYTQANLAKRYSSNTPGLLKCPTWRCSLIRDSYLFQL